MARTQILVHRWGAQNKDFGADLQTDLTSVKFRLLRRLLTLQTRRGPRRLCRLRSYLRT